MKKVIIAIFLVMPCALAAFENHKSQFSEQQLIGIARATNVAQVAAENIIKDIKYKKTYKTTPDIKKIASLVGEYAKHSAQLGNQLRVQDIENIVTGRLSKVFPRVSNVREYVQKAMNGMHDGKRTVLK